MKIIIRFAIIVATVCLMLSALATAKLPTVMSYQGRLTDATGNPVPDAGYNVRFRIYDANIGGTLIWEESQAVTTVDGLFDVTLGTSNPLDTSIFQEAERWLGIRVNSDPEMIPRVQLTTTPFAFIAGQADYLTVDPYVNETGDTVTGSLWLNGDGGDADGMIGVGPGYTNIRLLSWGAVKVELYGQDYGSLYLADGDGDRTAELDATNGAGGRLELSKTDGTSAMVMDAYYSGDYSTVLPENAINADEMMNEPGIVSSNNSSIITLTSAMQDLETVTITIPDAGYIVVEAKCYGYCYGTTGSNKGYLQIDETAGGSQSYPYYTFFGLAAYVTTGTCYFPAYVTRVYNKSTAGTYTFRLEGMEASSNDPSAITRSGDHILTATYYPTSYGTVEASVSADQVGSFDQSEVVVPTEREDGTSAQVTYKVDLRELELKAKQARIDALEAELALRRAQREVARQERSSVE